MPRIDALDRRIGLDRRTGSDRRGQTIGTHAIAIAIVDRRGAPAGAGKDRRAIDRRAVALRNRTEPSLPDPVGDVEPQLACPVCHGDLEYEVMLSWISPAYTVDTGYCAACSRRFLRTRNTGRYDAVSWAPLCRVCREPVVFVRALNGRRKTVYHCPMHPKAVWEHDTVTDEWETRA